MIRAHFNLKSLPFQTNLNPDSLFQSETFQEGMKRIDYLKDNRGIMLLTGEPGIGKSSMLRAFSSTLNNNCYQVFYIPLATVNVMDFYRQINFSLLGTRVHRKADLFHSIQEGIKSLVTNRKVVPVFIFDEAHLFKNENFFELQLILNFDFDSVCPAIVIVAGQSHLRDRLSREFLRSFSRRIAIKHHLKPFSKEETIRFIKHSIALVGGSESLFSDSALEAIFNNSQGNPAAIASISLKSLVAATTKKKNTVSEEEVFLAAKEL